MSRKSVKETIMERDGLTSEEADVQIAAFKTDLNAVIEQGGGPFSGLLACEELVESYFGLEPDYLDEFLF